MINDLILTGRSQEHLIYDELNKCLLHKNMINDFHKLQISALKEGFNIEVYSSFRSFEQQLNIWNNKATGKRVLLDDNGQPLDFNSLNKTEVIYSILRWSALPGASRHHWGTDIDIIDRSSIDNNFKIELTPQECYGDGPFCKMHDWLDNHLEDFNFFRPYDIDRGGIAPERWHISYKPIAELFLEQLTLETIEDLIEQSSIELKKEVLFELPFIYEKFIKNT